MTISFHFACVLVTTIVLNFNVSSLNLVSPYLSSKLSPKYSPSGSSLNSGYLAPEKDPEYRKMVKKSLQQMPPQDLNNPDLSLLDDEEQNLPIPKEGDIVECPGKWKGERVLGFLRNAQYSETSQTWKADILPLKEGKSNNVYSVDKDAKSITCNITEIIPVKAYFVRSENAYNVTMKSLLSVDNAVTDSSLQMKTQPLLQPMLRAPKYRTLTQSFVFPMKLKKLNATDLELDMEAYKQLKSRIIVDSIKLGGIASVFAWGVGGVDVGFAYTMGAIFGAGYLYLLGKKVDVIGYGVSTSIASQSISKKDEIAANARLLMPLFLVLSLVLRHKVIDTLSGGAGDITSTTTSGSSIDNDIDIVKSTRGVLHLLEKEEFLAAIAGFLTHRFTLFYTEIIGQMTTADWLSFLPGSFAETFRQKENMKNIMNSGAASSNTVTKPQDLITVICVTGPLAAGRTAVVNKFMQYYDQSMKPAVGGMGGGKSIYKKPKFALQACQYATYDQDLVNQFPDRYSLISKTEFDSLELTSSLLPASNDESTVTVASTTDKSNSKNTTPNPSSIESDVLIKENQSALYIGKYRNFFNGKESPIALLKNQFNFNKIVASNKKLPLSSLAPSKQVYIVEGPPSIMENLSKIENVRLINIWISLQTKEQFIKQATNLVQQQVLDYKEKLKTSPNTIMDDTKLAQLCTEKMFELVNEAAKDVQFYMSRAPLFEYTLLNSESEDETAQEMLDILQSAFQ